MSRKIKIELEPKVLHFINPAGTSRGTYTERKIWIIKLLDEETGRKGVGECAPLPLLSCDDLCNYQVVLQGFLDEIERQGEYDADKLRAYPSMLFGIESAFTSCYSALPYGMLFDTPFTRGEKGIPINGLIWMGDYRSMLKQIEHKLDLGFRCIKLKIGAIDFDKELKLLKFIRQHFSVKDVELRVDANGAFSPDEALEKLKYLSDYELHSIEQPIKAGNRDEMRQLIEESPLPIAFDEELIGCNNYDDKRSLLQTLQPHYIVLKPSLHGGMMGGNEWIKLADELNIGWWITSALESNIGLNAIAQWASTYDLTLPQGLGTGLLFHDNFDMGLEIRHDCLWHI